MEITDFPSEPNFSLIFQPHAGAFSQEVRNVSRSFTVAMDGQDEEQCLHRQISCRTIGYIIEKECSCSVNLFIVLRHNQNYTHREPCAQLQSNETYQCSVEVSGLKTVSKPRMTFIVSNHETQDCNIFQQFFTHQTSPANEVSSTQDTHHNSCKLKFTHVMLFFLTLKFHGYPHFSAENVDFFDFTMIVDARCCIYE